MRSYSSVYTSFEVQARLDFLKNKGVMANEPVVKRNMEFEFLNYPHKAEAKQQYYSECQGMVPYLNHLVML